MWLTEFALLAIVLLMPGSVFINVYRNLRSVKVKKEWEDYFEIILVSIVCYFLHSIVYSLFLFYLSENEGFVLVGSNSIRSITSGNITFDIAEIVSASFIAIILAFAFSFAKKRKYLYKIGMFLKVSERLSDEDLWYEFHQDFDMEWVTIRDFKSGLDYYGHISDYSDSREKREFIMRDITIFKDGTKIEYHADKMYFSREFDDFTIEYIDIKEKEELHDQERKNQTNSNYEG